MYKKFYKLNDKPFNIVPDPNSLYLSSKHKMALNYLEYGLRENIGFIVLTGEIGAGKTTIIWKILENIKDELEIAVIFNTNVSSEQLLELIINEFELEPSVRSKPGYLDTLNTFLINKYSEGQRVVLIIDEAQNLSFEVLEEIRMLSNLHVNQDVLLQIVLVGQPGLRDKIQHPSLVQLCQRIAVSYHLDSLSRKETEEYIIHRLKLADAENEKLFTSDAIDSIFKHSNGIPRTINIICDTALVYGYADELNIIDNKLIENVLTDRQDMGVWLYPSQKQKKDQFNNNSTVPQEYLDMSLRVQHLEQEISNLNMKIDKQLEKSDEKTTKYRDSLIDNLKKMLAEEREKTNRLLANYKKLREKLK
ncbi:general secretion pathway protein A [Candidatus Magnetomoraceae bacterium gMMP-15]